MNRKINKAKKFLLELEARIKDDHNRLTKEQLVSIKYDIENDLDKINFEQKDLEQIKKDIDFMLLFYPVKQCLRDIEIVKDLKYNMLYIEIKELLKFKYCYDELRIVEFYN